jgi:GMP synthase (glutamine-hydrolysing)
MTSKHALVLQHAGPEGPGLVAAALEAKEIEARVVRTDLGRPVPASIGEAAGLVVLGGPMGVGDEAKHPHLAAERRLIREAMEKRRPVLGICLGAQLLASALGAKVAPGARRELGWLPVTLGDEARYDPLFRELDPVLRPLHWHRDVFELPAGAVSLASSPLTKHQAFRHETAWGLLFHLEVSRAQVEEMTTLFAGEVREAGLTPEDLLLGMARHLAAANDVGARVFRRWARLL